MMTTTLNGLKAGEEATETLALRIVFLPRFWGSFESRYENGKNHLVPAQRTDAFRFGFTLCGHSARGSEDELIPSSPFPVGGTLGRGVCKKCAQVARKRGLAK